MPFGSWIKVGSSGTFKPTGQFLTDASDLEALESELDGHPNPRLILHFHGGLVDETLGLKIAQRMAQTYSQSGVTPITVIWATGIGETIAARLGALHNSKLFRKLLAWALSKAAEEIDLDGARGVEGGSLEPAEIEALLTTESGITELERRFDRAQFAEGARGRSTGDTGAPAELKNLQARLQIDIMRDPELIQLVDTDPIQKDAPELQSDDGGRSFGAASIALFVVKLVFAIRRRFSSRTNHDFLPTVVEELLRAAYISYLGKELWDQMKSTADAMWQDADTVGGYLLRRLETVQQRKPGFQHRSRRTQRRNHRDLPDAEHRG